ncbi:MAG: GNAT family N-acetyltransferase [Myxococcales bacterium]|nr:GNAT family N-acetyltransferase [Myxococcales bacterium]
MIVHTHIRPLDSDDLDAWDTLQRAELPAPLPRSDLMDTLEDRPPRAIGLFEEDGLVSVALGRLAEDELLVVQVMTRRDQRRRGLGRAVLRDAIARAKGRGATGVTLDVPRRNDAARALGASLGFVADRGWHGSSLRQGGVTRMRLNLRATPDA